MLCTCVDVFMMCTLPLFDVCLTHELIDGVSIIFFFEQKGAYELRMSDWSSDVCSSDLCLAPTLSPGDIVVMDNLPAHKVKGIAEAITAREIGRASCRERVCQYV